MRASAYMNKKQKAADNGDFNLTLSLSKDEADAFVKGEKSASTAARKAVRDALAAGPRGSSAASEE